MFVICMYYYNKELDCTVLEQKGTDLQHAGLALGLGGGEVGAVWRRGRLGAAEDDLVVAEHAHALHLVVHVLQGRALAAVLADQLQRNRTNSQYSEIGLIASYKI